MAPRRLNRQTRSPDRPVPAVHGDLDCHSATWHSVLLTKLRSRTQPTSRHAKQGLRVETASWILPTFTFPITKSGQTRP